MRTIEWTGPFKRDYKRESKGQHRNTLDEDLFPLVDRLANDQALEPRFRRRSGSPNSTPRGGMAVTLVAAAGTGKPQCELSDSREISSTAAW